MEIDELRPAQVAHVGQQRVAVEPRRKQPFAEGGRIRHIHPIEAGRTPCRLACLDDECRGVCVEAVGMCLEPAPFGFDEDEREGLEQLMRAEPGESIGALLDGRLEVIGITRADRAVDAVGRDDQIGIGELGDVAHLTVEDQFDAEIGGAFLQDVQQPLALDAAEAVPTRANDAAAGSGCRYRPSARSFR